MISLKIIFAENVFQKLKEEAERRQISITNTAYTIIKESLNVTKEVE